MSKKRRLQDNVVVNLTEECSAILRKKMPQKLKDPGSSTISCSIGDAHVSGALRDLGTDINLMFLSVYRALELGEVKTITITLQLVDRSITYPRGIVEDVLVKRITMLHRLPFLVIAEAKIDVKKGEFLIGVEDDEVVFNVFKEASNTSMEKVFVIEQSKKMECYRIAINAVEWAKRENSMESISVSS
ncbi:uncharacterized protein [Henckelia pumila]|uniref:uncharacterized protein n=1 Tax=Henckelia pumila TaxID=405737 RepID=UPI003C6DBD5C